jgi:hypothetical protein
MSLYLTRITCDYKYTLSRLTCRDRVKSVHSRAARVPGIPPACTDTLAGTYSYHIWLIREFAVEQLSHIG